MNTKILNLSACIFATFLSAALLFLAFPKHDLGWLGWFGLLPLLVVICIKGPKYGFFFPWVCGCIFFTAQFNWLFELQGYKLLYHAVLLPYMGLYWGVFGLAVGFISRRLGTLTALLSAPFMWVSLEYIRSNLSFLSLPWALLAQSQHQNTLMIQFVSFTGAYGVSFLVVMVNATLTALVLAFLYSPGRCESAAFYRPSGRGAISMTVATIVLAVSALVYGHMKLSNPVVGKEIKVSVVQGNIEQARKWDPNFSQFIMKTYTDLTMEASEDQPALIIWPETATPKSVIRDKSLFRQVRRIGRQAGTYLLIGSAQYRKFEGETSRKVEVFNSAFLIPSEETADNQVYSKIRLLPFGEYLPMKETIPWSFIKVPNVGRFVPGDEFTVFGLPAFRFGVTICWENLFPDLVRQFIKRGAQFIVNITNEAWFGKTAAPYLFLSMNVFRAVENRVYVVRCANTGVSCFIDPCGRIVGRVKDSSGQDIFVQGVLTKTITPLNSETFYTRYGDILPFGCIAFTLCVVVWSVLRAIRGVSNCETRSTEGNS